MEHRKLILYIACSLDGYIARANGSVDWLFTDQDYGYSEFYQSIDVVLMGRHSFEQILGFGEYPYADKQSIIFSSKSLPTLPDNVSVTNESPQRVVQQLQNQPGKHLWLLGGGKLISAFTADNLIDEYVISIHPVLLGRGIPLFKSGFESIQLKLTEQLSFSSGLVQLHYQRQNSH